MAASTISTSVTTAMTKLKQRAHNWKILKSKRDGDSRSMETVAEEYIDTESGSFISI